MVKMGAPALKPGIYKVRLRYTAKRDVSVRAHPLRPIDQSLEEAMKFTVGGDGPIELDHRPYRAEGAALTSQLRWGHFSLLSHSLSRFSSSRLRAFSRSA